MPGVSPSIWGTIRFDSTYEGLKHGLWLDCLEPMDEFRQYL